MSDRKDTNPKDRAATGRLPLDLVPDTARIYMAMGFAEGAAKYGAYNWRVAGVSFSVYVAATRRHEMKLWNGEWADPKTGVPHIASILAGWAIIADAIECGKLHDDRPPAVSYRDPIDAAEETIAHVRKLFSDYHPHHHTEADRAKEFEAPVLTGDWGAAELPVTSEEDEAWTSRYPPEMTEAPEGDECPNCVSEFKCNGPHITALEAQQEQERRNAVYQAELRQLRQQALDRVNVIDRKLADGA